MVNGYWLVLDWYQDKQYCRDTQVRWYGWQERNCQDVCRVYDMISIRVVQYGLVIEMQYSTYNKSILMGCYQGEKVFSNLEKEMPFC